MPMENINIKPFIKEEMKKMMNEIMLISQAYIGKEMNNSSVNSKWRMGGKGGAIGKNKNTTNTLRNVSGRLFKSFNPTNEETASKVVKNDTNTGFEITIGSDVPYARIHDLGGTISNGFGRGISITIPKRPYFTKGMNRFSKEKYNEIIQKYIDNIIYYWNNLN